MIVLGANWITHNTSLSLKSNKIQPSSIPIISMHLCYSFCLDSKRNKHQRFTEYFLHSVNQQFTMNPKLTWSQQNKICSELGHVRLKLLYKASIHGFTSEAFHQRCDNHCPTVSVAYNTSDYVFGGYTTQPFSQSGQYVSDEEAFLFTFSGENLLKYPVTSPEYAVRMMANNGPYFGEALVLLHANQATVYSCPGSYFTFNEAQMHGNNLTLVDCEVYQVEGKFSLNNPILVLVLNNVYLFQFKSTGVSLKLLPHCVYLKTNLRQDKLN